MALNINVASIKELTKLPGIGTKYAETIIAVRTEIGTVTLTEFHQMPALQTKLNELLNDKRITFEQSIDTSLDHSEKQEDEGKLQTK